MLLLVTLKKSLEFDIFITIMVWLFLSFFRIYLRNLRIEVEEAESGRVLGYGESHQDSLPAMGSTYQQVVERAVWELIPPDR